MESCVRIPLLLAAAALGAPATACAQDGTRLIAFEHVGVIAMDRDTVLPDHTVVVEGERIVRVGPAASTPVPAGATRIDGRGKFLLPGLTEMHGHIPPGVQVADSTIERVLAFYALNGVTTVRGMLGHPRHLPFRARANAGDMLAPFILTSGPSLNGQSVPDAATGVRLVREQHEAGYDLLKIHPGIAPEPFDALAAEARRLGIPFAGHVPLAVGIRRALAAGIHTVDHADGYLEGLAWDGAGSPPESQMFGFNLVGELEWSRLDALVDATRASGAGIVATQSLFESIMGPLSPEELAARPEMAYWPAATVAQWAQFTGNIRGQLGITPATGRAFLDARGRMLRALHAAGVPFLLGSDAPQFWNVPGFATLRELEAMVAAGFSPYEALRMGSVDAAAFLEMEDEFGRVAPGLRADLVLLDANPLEDVAHWARRAGVMVRGAWYDRAEIERRLR